MLKMIVVLLSMSVNVHSVNELNKTDTEESNSSINTILMNLYAEYGYKKEIPEKNIDKLRSDLQYKLRLIVQNEEQYNSYALFLLGQLNEGEADNVINKLLLNNNWQQQFDVLKTIFFFGYPDSLSQSLLDNIQKNHWFGGMKMMSKNIVYSLDKDTLSFEEKLEKWEEFLDQFYDYIGNCKLDNRDSSVEISHDGIDQIDNRLKELLIANDVLINRLSNINVDLNGFKLIASLSNKLVIVNSNYELTLLNTMELKAKHIIQHNNRVLILLNGHDVSGHDQLFLLNTEEQNFNLKYLFKFLYYVENVKKRKNTLTFHGSNWTMRLDTRKLSMSEINVCDTNNDIRIGL